MKNLREAATNMISNEKGQGMIEYAILVGLIAVGAITFMTPIGTWVKNQFSTLNSSL